MLPDGTPSLQSRVAKRISGVRRQQGLTQEELARRLGIALKNLQRLESGKQNLTLQTIARVAAVLDVQAERLLVDPPLAPVVSAHLPLIPPVPVPPRAVPVLHLEAAAGWVARGDLADLVGWTLLAVEDEKPFVAQVVDRSMEPLIPDGSWSLFRGGAVELDVGRFVLVEHRPADVASYHVKRVVRLGQRLQLESVNRAYAPIVLDTETCHQWRVVGEWLSVVAAGAR